MPCGLLITARHSSWYNVDRDVLRLYLRFAGRLYLHRHHIAGLYLIAGPGECAVNPNLAAAISFWMREREYSVTDAKYLSSLSAAVSTTNVFFSFI